MLKTLYEKYKELIRYVIVGLLTTVVSLGTYFLCTHTFLDPAKALQLQAANVISWVAAVTFAYFTNRSYVFQSQNKNMLAEAGSFFLSRVGTLLLDMGIMWVGATLLGVDDKIMKLVVQVVVTVANYLLGKLVVFRKKNREDAE